MLSLCWLLCAASPSITGAVELTSARNAALVYNARVGTSVPVGKVLLGLEAGSRGTLLDTSGLFAFTLAAEVGQLRASLLVGRDQLTPSLELLLKLGAGVALNASCAWLPTGTNGSVGLTATPGPVSLSLRVDTAGTLSATAAFTYAP